MAIIPRLILRYPLKYTRTARKFCTQASLTTDAPPEPVISRADIPQPEILKYFESASQDHVKNFPPHLLRRKTSSDHLYVTNAEWARTIVRHLKATGNPLVPIVELNPGLGILTKELLEATNPSTFIHCVENQKIFKVHMESLFMENVDRMTYSEGDLMKICLKDSLDSGQRMVKYLGAKRGSWEDDPCVKIVGGVGTPDFFKHLINMLVYQHSLFAHGRCEFLLFVSPSVLLRYICNERAGYFSYRPRAVLFQLLFEYEILEMMPRKDFLPWVNAPKKNSKLSRINDIHPEYLYLVRVVPRRNLLTVCPAEHLSTLSYFVKQVMSSGKHRVIPYLEKWIENCGVRIILKSGNSPAVAATPAPVVQGQRLPDFVNASQPRLLVEHECLPSINIFSEFGEISPQHIYRLFHDFIHWPEYADCSFVGLMQQHYVKMMERKEAADGEGRRR